METPGLRHWRASKQSIGNPFEASGSTDQARSGSQEPPLVTSLAHHGTKQTPLFSFERTLDRFQKDTAGVVHGPCSPCPYCPACAPPNTDERLESSSKRKVLSPGVGLLGCSY